ncbi:hypothetical protein TKK_0012221 [Trichogramma kaykai]
MIDTGNGPTQINLLLSFLNVPSLSCTTMKRNERKVGAAIGEDLLTVVGKNEELITHVTGHTAVVGFHLGKILFYAVRSKDCWLCSFGHSPEDHDGRKNHTGSVKFMEPSMAVELFTKTDLLDKNNVKF